MAMGDAAIAAFDTKYYYSLWRPVTAVRNGDTDGNAKTDSDPAWLPLVGTPAFPSYPSAHATLSNAARRVLEKTLGKSSHAITLTNPTLPAIALNYTAWDQITDDIDDAAFMAASTSASIRKRRAIREATSARFSSNENLYGEN